MKLQNPEVEVTRAALAFGVLPQAVCSALLFLQAPVLNQYTRFTRKPCKSTSLAARVFILFGPCMALTVLRVAVPKWLVGISEKFASQPARNLLARAPAKGSRFMLER